MTCAHGLPSSMCGQCEPDSTEFTAWREYTEELTHEIMMRDSCKITLTPEPSETPNAVVDSSEVSMLRQPVTHPTMPDRTIMRCTFNHEDEQRDWQLAVPKEMPAGYQCYWRWIGGNVLEFGIEAVAGSPALSPPGGDSYDTMSMEDLQTLAPQRGIKHARNKSRGDLIAALRIQAKETAK
jgi:hypothetical protein